MTNAIISPLTNSVATQYKVINKTGAQLNAGQFVYISGYDATSGLLTIAAALAGGSLTQAQFFLVDGLADGASGVVYAEAIVSGVDTSGASAVGSPVYLSTTAGGWTTTAPTNGAVQQIVGRVTVKSSTVGAFLISFDVPRPGAQNPGILLQTRQRITLANVNAGATLLPAIPGYKYRMVFCDVIAIGGAAAAGTTVDILATQAASGVKLVAYAQASLTQSAVLKDGGSGAAVLADGASYVANDVNTAITIGKTGSAFTTATNFDVILGYSLEV